MCLAISAQTIETNVSINSQNDTFNSICSKLYQYSIKIYSELKWIHSEQEGNKDVEWDFWATSWIVRVFFNY